MRGRGSVEKRYLRWCYVSERYELTAAPLADDHGLRGRVAPVLIYIAGDRIILVSSGCRSRPRTHQPRSTWVQNLLSVWR